MTTAATVAAPRALRRDVRNGWIGGVCAGLADFFGLDVRLVRVAYALLSVFTAFAGVLVYVVLWILLPP